MIAAIIAVLVFAFIAGRILAPPFRAVFKLLDFLHDKTPTVPDRVTGDALLLAQVAAAAFLVVAFIML